MERIVTMQEIAKVLEICDKYLINKYQTTLEQLMEMEIEDKTEIILMLLLTSDEISTLFDQYNLRGIMYEFLEDYSKKKIFSISDETLRLSTKRPASLTASDFVGIVKY